MMITHGPKSERERDHTHTCHEATIWRFRGLRSPPIPLFKPLPPSPPQPKVRFCRHHFGCYVPNSLNHNCVPCFRRYRGYHYFCSCCQRNSFAVAWSPPPFLCISSNCSSSSVVAVAAPPPRPTTFRSNSKDRSTPSLSFFIVIHGTMPC